MNTKSTFGLTLGSAFIASIAMSPVAEAAQNPFAMQALEQGYMTADASAANDSKVKEMNCGASMKMDDGKNSSTQKVHKSTIAKPAGDKKMSEAKCGGSK